MAGTELILHPNPMQDGKRVNGVRMGPQEYRLNKGGTVYEPIPRSRVERLWAQTKFTPTKVHRLIEDTFVRNGSQTALKTAAGYGAAAASGGASAWAAHKFLPKSLQGAARKVAVTVAGLGGSALPGLVRRLIFRR